MGGGGAIAAEIGAQAATDIISSAFGYASTKSVNKANKQASKSAHQWEVDDLRKAGLNPILSAGGSGAAIPQQLAFTPDLDAGGAVKNALQHGSLDNETKIANESVKTAVTQQNLNSAAAARTIAETNVSKKQLDVMQSQMRLQETQARMNSASAQAEEYENTRRKLDSQIYDIPVVGPAMRIFEKLSPVGGLTNILNATKKRPGTTINNKYDYSNKPLPTNEKPQQVILPSKGR